VSLNLGHAISLFFPVAVDSLQYSEFYFGKPAWAKAKHTIAADINGYSWCCLAMGHGTRAFVFAEKLKILGCY
jgi:hypothetical protein